MESIGENARNGEFGCEEIPNGARAGIARLMHCAWCFNITGTGNEMLWRNK